MKRRETDPSGFCLRAARLLLACAALGVCAAGCGTDTPTVRPAVVFSDQLAIDQDDLCIWVNDSDASRSTVIASDKKANMVFVYDLLGKTLQAVATPRPGNIDVRHGFPLGGDAIDVVAWNQRGDTGNIVICKVNPQTRQLERIDNGNLPCPDAYGGALYRSAKTGDLYFFTTSKTGAVCQYRLHDDGTGRVGGEKVRTLMLGACEAAVADDEQGLLYVAAEKEGVWEFGAEPRDPLSGRLIARVGGNGLRADVEGLAIYPTAGSGGFLIVSSQSNSRFNAYERQSPHRFVGAFHVHGVLETDGIDAVAVNLGGVFSEGLFACHNGASRDKCPIVLVPWRSIARTLGLAGPPESHQPPAA